MTQRQFYDWQTLGGAKHVFRLVAALEEREISWCMIGGLAVNHWALEPIHTIQVDVVVVADQIEGAAVALQDVGFSQERTQNALHFNCESKVVIRIMTEKQYLDFPKRAVPANVHGILMRVSSLADTLAGTLIAPENASEKPSHRQKRLLEISRLIELHPELCQTLPSDLVAKLAS